MLKFLVNTWPTYQIIVNLSLCMLFTCACIWVAVSCRNAPLQKMPKLRENSSSHSYTDWHLYTQYKETNYKPCHFFFINLSHISSKKLPMNSSSCLGLPFFLSVFSAYSTFNAKLRFLQIETLHLKFFPRTPQSSQSLSDYLNSYRHQSVESVNWISRETALHLRKQSEIILEWEKTMISLFSEWICCSPCL